MPWVVHLSFSYETVLLSFDFFSHGALVLSLFCWQVPLADKVFPGRVIEVCLIQSPPVSFAKKEARKLFKQKEVRVPSRGQKRRGEGIPPSPTEEEKKTERAEKEDILQGIPPLPAALNEEPVLLGEELLSSAHGGEEDKAMKAPSSGTPESAVEGIVGIEFFGLHRIPDAKRRTKDGQPAGGHLRKDRRRKQGEAKPGPYFHHTSLTQIQQQIMRKIEAAKRYPKVARKMGIEGTAVVRFKLKPQGKVEAVEIAESSGSEILDNASLQTVRDAAPLPYKEGSLKVGIVFKIL